METKVSTKGQVVLPGPIRRRLGIRAGDQLDVKVEAGRIVLVLRKKRSHEVKIIPDAVTGLPTLSAEPDSPQLSSREVSEILATFP